ncbi:MAG: hypothetical protein COZ29_01945 [Candidatus Moranbacteria bacterium CG_4_10_14_3_um_filter_45_9]|nr:MAG: hypothetical protein AUK19_01290 [Candidatus Moranbacteria bacterium CG2_30_45_14]PIX90067.1 MAG: hypothetical protein COZ29_01945 [Candidatus Moranbacteria bacterium CG_4_10_14_3_um_filter_45_9]PJA85786.1 MAG: hypothetical protein CO143_00835 [Candidatus Moranbacteria bacterium CG_4_9_14_3_um_filter_45_14]
MHRESVLLFEHVTASNPSKNQEIVPTDNLLAWTFFNPPQKAEPCLRKNSKLLKKILSARTSDGEYSNHYGVFRVI